MKPSENHKKIKTTLDNYIQGWYDKYCVRCVSHGTDPVNYESFAKVIKKSASALTIMAKEGHSAESKPFVVLKLDDTFSYIAQIEGDQVRTGIVDQAALDTMFQKGGDRDVPQDNRQG